MLLVASALAIGYSVPSPAAGFGHALQCDVRMSQRFAGSRMVATTEGATASADTDGTQAPLLVRAARGEKVEKTPVWMMRQAGRHMAAYRALVSKYPTFRERSETPEVRACRRAAAQQHALFCLSLHKR